MKHEYRIEVKMTQTDVFLIGAKTKEEALNIFNTPLDKGVYTGNPDVTFTDDYKVTLIKD